MSEASFDAETLKAFAHPLRMKIYDQLATYGSATATHLAERLGENTGQTSYHLRILAKYGLVEDDPEAPAEGRERWWRAARTVRMEPEVLTDPSVQAASQLVLSAVVQERAEALQNWYRQAPNSGPWLEHNVTNRLTTHLTPDEAADLIDEVSAVLERFIDRRTEKERPAGSERVRVYFDVFPLLEDL